MYLQVAEEANGDDEPRYFDLPLTIQVDEEVIPGNLIVEQKSQTTLVGSGQTIDLDYRIDNLNNVEVDVVISVKAPDGWDATLDDGEIISFTLEAFSSDDFTMQITAPDKIKSGEVVEFELTVTPTSYQECTANLCYIQKPTFEFKTESSSLINSILSEIEDPEPTTVALFLSVLVLAGFGCIVEVNTKSRLKCMQQWLNRVYMTRLKVMKLSWKKWVMNLLLSRNLMTLIWNLLNLIRSKMNRSLYEQRTISLCAIMKSIAYD